MLSYMLPTGDKPPPGDCTNHLLTRVETNHSEQITRNGSLNSPINKITLDANRIILNNNSNVSTMTMIPNNLSSKIDDDVMCDSNRQQHHHLHHQIIDMSSTESPNKINGGVTNVRKSTLHTSKVTKDDSLHSINSEASTVGSDRKSKIANGGKHANLKRVSFGSSKGSMVETLVYETPVQEEPEINHFLDHNGRLPILPVPDTDEGREKVRVAFLGPQPHPATPGVLLLEPLLPLPGHLIDTMSTGPVELLTTHTEHTSPAYHAQLSTDSGWDNPFRPDGDLSREADEIVELIKGGKPITPTPGQNAPPLPGCDGKTTTVDEHDSSTSPLLNSSNVGGRTNQQGNGTSHGNANSVLNKQPVNEKVGSATNTAMVEVGRVTAQGPGDASQVEHVTLKKKPKCKCCVLQ